MAEETLTLNTVEKMMSGSDQRLRRTNLIGRTGERTGMCLELRLVDDGQLLIFFVRYPAAFRGAMQTPLLN